jgi:hypothetical protein
MGGSVRSAARAKPEIGNSRFGIVCRVAESTQSAENMGPEQLSGHIPP